MESKYTCECGCEVWIISSNEIECSHCGNTYSLIMVFRKSASEFNEIMNEC